MRTIILLAALLFALTSPSFTSPSFGADDVAAAQSVIRSQVEAFARGDAVAAYSLAASGIHEKFPAADIFLGMVQHSYVYRHKSFEFGETRAADGKIAQRSVSSMTTACRGRRFTRWNSSRTALSGSLAAS